MRKCECGCGQEIVEKPHHNWPCKKPPRFLRGHYVRTDAFKRIKESTRGKPPEGWIPPNGLCGCGCGQKTKIARQNVPKRNHWKGYPVEFVQGHHMRLVPPGPNHPGSHGMRILTERGYWMLRMPGHPLANSIGYVAEHRYVWSQHNGRLPGLDEDVHHINTDTMDNRPENLTIIKHGDHSSAHQKLIRDKISKRIKALYADPEYKARWLAGRKGMVTPAYRKRLKRAVKQAWKERKAQGS